MSKSNFYKKDQIDILEAKDMIVDFKTKPNKTQSEL